MKQPVKFPVFILLLSLAFSSVSGQQVILPLWENKIPNRVESDEEEEKRNENILWITKVQIPTIEVYLPTKQQSTGQAVVICPGGGYHGLAYDWEGTDIAKWLNSKGIAGIALKYRVPKSESVTDRHQVPLIDAQRAIRLVRKNAEQWNIDKDKIGVMGFSAGGHLASTLGTHFDEEFSYPKDSIDMISTRPDFMILIYPVITMQEKYTHQGSKDALLGENPITDMVDYYSNELQVKQNTPPTFLLHASDDDAVPVENSLLMYRALKDKNIPVEMHIFPTGGHGFSLGLGNDHLNSWTDLLTEWISLLE